MKKVAKKTKIPIRNQVEPADGILSVYRRTATHTDTQQIRSLCKKAIDNDKPIPFDVDKKLTNWEMIARDIAKISGFPSWLVSVEVKLNGRLSDGYAGYFYAESCLNDDDTSFGGELPRKYFSYQLELECKAVRDASEKGDITLAWACYARAADAYHFLVLNAMEGDFIRGLRQRNQHLGESGKGGSKHTDQEKREALRRIKALQKEKKINISTARKLMAGEYGVHYKTFGAWEKLFGF